MEMVAKRHVITFTHKELQLLNRGLSAGIMDDGIETIGLTKREQHMLARVGNRLLDACGSSAPRYWESEPTGERK
jgi:hypothetical protein